MPGTPERITIHTKKFYRVVLESIDADAETPESFAVKLSSRIHVPIARAKLVTRCLPFIAKSGLNAEQANRFKTILEELGGKARVEPYFVTPGDPKGPEAAPGTRTSAGTPFLCPECGSEQPAGAAFCPFCLRKFRNASSRPASLEERLPAENPIETGVLDGRIDWLDVVRLVRRRPSLALAALVAVLIVIVLLK